MWEHSCSTALIVIQFIVAKAVLAIHGCFYPPELEAKSEANLWGWKARLRSKEGYLLQHTAILVFLSTVKGVTVLL